MFTDEFKRRFSGIMFGVGFFVGLSMIGLVMLGLVLQAFDINIPVLTEFIAVVFRVTVGTFGILVCMGSFWFAFQFLKAGFSE